MDTKVKKLEDEINKDFLSKKTRMVRQEARDHDNKVTAYHHELISLMPWLGPHISKHSDQGSALQMVKCTMPTVTIQGRDSPWTMTEDMMELYTSGATTWLAKGRTVLALQVVVREHETIKYSARGLRDVGDVHRSIESQGPWQCTGGCAATQVGQKVTIEVNIHDGMLELRPNGVGDRHLRRNLWERFGKIYHQGSINEP